MNGTPLIEHLLPLLPKGKGFPLLDEDGSSWGVALALMRDRWRTHRTREKAILLSILVICEGTWGSFRVVVKVRL